MIVRRRWFDFFGEGLLPCNGRLVSFSTCLFFRRAWRIKRPPPRQKMKKIRTMSAMRSLIMVGVMAPVLLLAESPRTTSLGMTAITEWTGGLWFGSMSVIGIGCYNECGGMVIVAILERWDKSWG